MEISRDIPKEIIELVAKCLLSIEDFTTFGCVCKSWSSAILAVNKQFAPCIMLPTYDQPQQFQKFYSLSKQKYFSLPLPQTARRKCWGSPFGWLVTIGPDLQIHLLNPFSRIQLPLPPQPTCLPQFAKDRQFLRNNFVQEFVLSTSPEPNQDCLVLAISRHVMGLAVARPGDETWTLVRSPLDEVFISGIFYNGEFYVATLEKLFVIRDVDTYCPEVEYIASFPARSHQNVCVPYLVEMSGDLLYVQRALHQPPHILHDQHKFTNSHGFSRTTYSFEVHQFKSSERSWTKLSGLGDYSMFLGSNTPFAISTTDYPEFERNSIYFTSHYSHPYDIGVYDFKEDTVEPICVGYEVSKFSSPLFVMPSL